MADRRRGALHEIEIGGSRFVVVELPAPPAVAAGVHVLTPVERELARAVRRGLSNREIARARGRSERTIANQLHRIFKKLGVASRAELAARGSLEDW